MNMTAMASIITASLLETTDVKDRAPLADRQGGGGKRAGRTNRSSSPQGHRTIRREACAHRFHG